VGDPVVVRPAADTRAAANGDGEPDGGKAAGDKADEEKAPGDKGGEGAAAPDKGAFLRMFSGLRES
jgi:hypothetical protein